MRLSCGRLAQVVQKYTTELDQLHEMEANSLVQALKVMDSSALQRPGDNGSVTSALLWP